MRGHTLLKAVESTTPDAFNSRIVFEKQTTYSGDTQLVSNKIDVIKMHF